MPEDYRITGLSELGGEYEPKSKKKVRWWIFIPLIILVIAIVSGGVYYLLWKKQKNKGISKLHKFSAEELHEQKLYPAEVPNDIELQKAIQQFKDGYLKAAKANFYDILQSTKSKQVKSFAAVYLGIISDEEGKFSLAIDFFNRALKFEGKNFYAYYNLAVALKHSGRHIDAVRALEQAEKIRPELFDAQILKGKLQYEANELDKAEETLKEVTEQNRNPLAIYNLGKVYKRKGNLVEAKAAFLDALDLAGAGEVAYQSANELGILYASGGEADLPNAREYFKRAIALAPYRPKYYYNLALVEYRLNHPEGAIQALNEAARHGADTPKTFVYIARLYSELGRPTRAEEALRKGLEKSPNDIEVLSSLADNLIHQGKWDLAIRFLKKILTTSSKTLSRSQALYNLGLVHGELKDWRKALDYLKRSQGLDPTNDDILTALGRVYVNRDQPHKAVSAFKEALKINPYNTKILQESSKIYIQLGLLSEAEESLQRILESSKKKPEELSFAYYSLGKLHKKRKDFDTAMDHFDEVLKSEHHVYQYDSLLQISDSILQANKPAPLSYPYLQKAIALKPREVEPRFLLAKALLNENTIESRSKSEEELLSIIETQNVDPILLSKTHTLRGILYYKDGLYLKALDDFNRALEIDPSNDEAFQNKRATSDKLENSG